MSGTDTQQTSTTSGPSNKDVNNTLSALAKGITTEVGKPAWSYGQSLYVPTGSTTATGQSKALTAANNPAYSSGINSAMGFNNNLISSRGFSPEQSSLYGEYGDMADAYDGNTPGISTLRNKVIDDTMVNTNALFGNSGRFGGGSHSKALGEGLGNALAGFDANTYDKSVANRYASAGARSGLAQQANANAGAATAALPGLFAAGQLPASIYGQVGAAQDANANAVRQGDFDLQTRTKNARTDQLAKLSSIAAGNAQSGGQTSTTTTPQQPWWMQLGGLGLAGLGAFL